MHLFHELALGTQGWPEPHPCPQGLVTEGTVMDPKSSGFSGFTQQTYSKGPLRAHHVSSPKLGTGDPLVTLTSLEGLM